MNTFVANSFVNGGNYFILSWLNYKIQNIVLLLFQFINAIPWKPADISFYTRYSLRYQVDIINYVLYDAEIPKRTIILLIHETLME